MLKLEKLDHVPVSVKDMEKAKELFSCISETDFSPALSEEKSFKIESSPSSPGIELIASPECVLSATIERRKGGLAPVLLQLCQHKEQRGAFLAALSG